MMKGIILYLAAVNGLGFLLCSSWCKGKALGGRNFLFALYGVIIAGGGAGSLAAFIAAKQGISKENAMLWLLSLCIPVVSGIWSVVYFLGVRPNYFYFIPWFREKWFWLLWGIGNGISFLLFGWDKLAAVKEWTRLPVRFLLILALLGGEFGEICGMIAFRHKIRKPYFFLGLPLIGLVHYSLFVFLTSEWFLHLIECLQL